MMWMDVRVSNGVDESIAPANCKRGHSGQSATARTSLSETDVKLAVSQTTLHLPVLERANLSRLTTMPLSETRSVAGKMNNGRCTLGLQRVSDSSSRNASVSFSLAILNTVHEAALHSFLSLKLVFLSSSWRSVSSAKGLAASWRRPMIGGEARPSFISLTSASPSWPLSFLARRYRSGITTSSMAMDFVATGRMG